MRPHGSIPTPTCPRCEYDLSGVVASWQTECPLKGVCSECGEPLDWSDVLTAPARDLAWFIEHLGWLLRLYRRALSTLFRAIFTPRSFWKALALHPSVRVSRLLIWLPLLLLSFHLAKGLMANAARGIVHYTERSSYWYWLAWASDDWTQPFMLIFYNPSPRMSVLNRQWQLITWPPPAWGLLVASVAAPLILLTIGVFTQRPDLRTSRVARAGIYGLCWIPVFWLVAIADSAVRLARCTFGLLAGGPLTGADVETIYDPLWSIWPWWGACAAAWWVWWWKCVIVDGWRPSATDGLSQRDSIALAVPVIGISLSLGLMATATAQMYWR